ncbi:MAG: hypothetical protein RI897_3349 [Verrucomicrobiota bacterium]|jgi:HlyD family secretion protein
MKTFHLISIVLLTAAAGLAAGNILQTVRTARGASVTQSPTLPTQRVIAEGRVVAYPGRQVQVGSEAGGLITRLHVEENQPLEQGALIAELRSNDLQAQLAEARARIKELEAECQLAQAQIERTRQLHASGTLSTEEQDRTQRDVAVYHARLASAEATVQLLLAQIDKTRITAPIGGTVLQRFVDPGEVIQPGTTLVTLADLSSLRIEAEVDEYDASRVRAGAPVSVTAEGFPDAVWQGTVEEVPFLVVQKQLQPQNPARPVDVRVLLAKISLSDDTPLKLGQRVEVEILDVPNGSIDRLLPVVSDARMTGLQVR